MARKSRGAPLHQAKAEGPPKRRGRRDRTLNALEIAEGQIPEKLEIRPHRLGVVDDDSDDANPAQTAEGPPSKRRKTSTADDDESSAGRSDSEGHRWHIGVENDDDDSDIDSENAFGESDEERFSSFAATRRGHASASQTRTPPTSTGTTFGKRKSAGLGLEEVDARRGSMDNESELDDDFGDDAVDLATAWDMDGDEQPNVAGPRRSGRPSNGKAGREERDESGSGSGSGPDDEDEDEDEDEDGDDMSADDNDSDSQLSVSDDEGDGAGLQDFVQAITRRPSDVEPRRSPERRMLAERPSQFGLTSKVSAADLLRYIKQPQQRQALKVLQSAQEQGGEVYKGGVPGKLAPPLAKRQQDQLDRAAAYDETKKELHKWIETVKRNRRAEHLAFPLVEPADAAPSSGKTLGSTGESQPMSALESTIEQILVESGMQAPHARSAEDAEQAYETLHEKHMPLDEVQTRRAELRRARDLMFREEIRARRIKKIKSKAYRRVHRKERDKAELERRHLLEAQHLLDSDAEKEKNDRQRAEARMGARHRESRWAKSVRQTGRGAWDADARHGVGDLARRDEDLRRRMDGKRDVGSDDAASDSSDSDHLSAAEEGPDGLQEQLDDLDAIPDDAHTRLGSMAFMKRAEAARKAANDEELRQIRRALADGVDAGDPVAHAAGPDDDGPVAQGRQKFGSAPTHGRTEVPAFRERNEFEERESDAEIDGYDDAPDDHAASTAITLHTTPPRPTIDRARPNGAATSVGKKPHSHGPSGGRTGPSSVLATGPQPAADHARGQLDDYTSPSESEDERDGQAALARAIFAGPDAIQRDFAAEKQATVDEEGDQVVDIGLPGWGSWTGEGISKKAQKRGQRGRTIVKGVRPERRQDAQLERVIINEKRVKKNAKYLAGELPHPFESRQQYERSLRLPLGPEWTTKSTFQDATKPRVLLKPGIIRPMERPLV